MAAFLKTGVLLKLLEDMMKTDLENAIELDDPKPVLLQIRSIIPVLEEGDLWPNRGFFLKVSDSSHALYVSLTQEQNEMILGNILKLGQFIHVQKLENADPVPLLRGVTPVPGGRRPCDGAPEDIISQANLVNSTIVEKGVILEKTISKNSESSRKGRSRSLSASRARPCEIRVEDIEKTGFNGVGGWSIGGWPKSRPSSVDNDSDADSVVSSSSSSRISKRKSWNQSEILGVKEIFDSSIVRHEIRPLPRSRSANVSPVRSVRYDSSDDNSSSVTRRRSLGSVKRLVKSSTKSQSQAPVPKVGNVQMASSLCGLVCDRKGAENGISWNSLPLNLVKCGKEVVRQRDIALLAAADALQEACASERLLNSLSTLSEFPLAEGDDLQPYVDKFFDLQDDLARTRLIMQSLTSISPFRTQETEPCTTNSIKETLNIALERKKNATTWIKSAVALDLSPVTLDPLTNPMASTNTTKKTNPTGRGNKPKGACIINKKNVDMTFVLASDKDDQPEWTKGSTLPAVADLANALQDGCGNLFLSCVEKYLDEVERKSLFVESDDRTTEMMYKVKMVSDWLDVIVSKEDGEKFDESENEVYGRVRSKIYGILLKHVERTCHGF